MTVFWIVFGILAIFALALLAGGLYMLGYAMRRDFPGAPPVTPESWDKEPHYASVGDAATEKIRDGVRWLYRANRERGVEMTLTAHDGVRLIGHYLPPEVSAENPNGIYLMVHGYRSCGLRDFALAVENLSRDGIGCFILEHRGHGGSGGQVITFGFRERYDVRDWAYRLSEAFPDTPILLDGVSMGASTVLAAAALDLPRAVVGIIADCGYTSMHDIFVKILRQWFHLPPIPLLPVTEWLSRRLLGFGFSDVCAEETVTHARVPVLIAHGMGDTFVPYPMAEQIYRAAVDAGVDAELFSVPEAEHGLSYLVDYNGYCAAIARLYEKCGIRVEDRR